MNQLNGTAMAPSIRRQGEWSAIRPFLDKAPVDVGKAAESLGIKVLQSGLGPRISGILRRDPSQGARSGYVIIVNDAHPFNRQRFTVAHELGHFVLHRSDDFTELADDEFYRALPGPLEREANEFAADILMPWALINSLMAEGCDELPKIADRLKVSRQALAIRLGLTYDQEWDK